MKLYHGSVHIVREPKILDLTHNVDFGRGFYCSSFRQQAISFAQGRLEKRNDVDSAFVNIYDFDKESAYKNLKTLEFKEGERSWFDFVLANRDGQDVAKDYDIVYGPVANDCVHQVVRFYETGVYTYEEAFSRLSAFELYDQYVFKTDLSLEYISFSEILEVK
ncbi:hypothetical protein FACS1894125_2860 [Actinomycetota bacterium]|nr:hypothetical protein FACS1894125_2860 [Actinomycetota bacterium]